MPWVFPYIFLPPIKKAALQSKAAFCFGNQSLTISGYASRSQLVYSP